jgi:hypothetical protein
LPRREPAQLIGVLLASLLGGFFPVLLLVAGRRKGNVVPGVAPRLAGHPLVLGLIYLLYLAGLLMHGLLIWQEPLQRAAALGVALLGIAMPTVLLRGGAFRRRAVIELYARPDGRRPATCAVSGAGRPRPVEVDLRYDGVHRSLQAASGEIPDFAALRSASFRWLPGAEAGASALPPGVSDAKVWAHSLAPDGGAQVIPAAAEVEAGEFTLASLDEVAARPDALGQLGRVFQRMAHEVYAREQSLKRQVQELRIQIDEAKKAREVAEITESDYLPLLKERARRLRDGGQD